MEWGNKNGSILYLLLYKVLGEGARVWNLRGILTTVYAIEGNLGKLNKESVVKMAGSGLKRRQKASEKKLPLTRVKCARARCPATPHFACCYKILQPSISSLKNIPVKKVEKNHEEYFWSMKARLNSDEQDTANAGYIQGVVVDVRTAR